MFYTQKASANGITQEPEDVLRIVKNAALGLIKETKKKVHAYITHSNVCHTLLILFLEKFILHFIVITAGL